MLKLCRSVRASPAQIFWQVRLPYATPLIMSGLKVGMTLAITGVIVSEFVTAQSGLGYIILFASSNLQIDLMFADADGFAVYIARLIEHAEAIPFLQIVVEIDIARKHIRERQRDRAAGILQGKQAHIISARTLRQGVRRSHEVRAAIRVHAGEAACVHERPAVALQALHDEAFTAEQADTELALEGMTMIVVTHEMGFAHRAAHRVAFMDQGEILEDSPKQSFFSAPATPRAREFLSKILTH